MHSKLRSLVAAVGAVGLFFAAPAAHGDSVKELAAIAAKKPPVIWYESTPPDQAARVVAAFNKRYPDIKVQYVRSTGGGGIAAKVIQESEAGAATASFIVADVQQLFPLNERGFLVSRDWKPLGVDPALVRAPFAVAVTAAIGVLVWNKNRVSEADLPKDWNGFLDSKWKGRLGVWVRTPTLATLAKDYGEQRMSEYVKSLLELKPMIYPSTFQLAQQVAAGEIDIGMGLYHSTVPVVKSGAPLGVRFLDPTPLTVLYGAVISKGGNPDGAQVLLAWLTTPEGALAYEEAVGRGNPFIKETDTAKEIGQRRRVEYAFDESKALERLETELTKMMMSAGKQR